MTHLSGLGRAGWLLSSLVVVSGLAACSGSGTSVAATRAAFICGAFNPPSASPGSTTTLGPGERAEALGSGWTTAGRITTLATQELGHPLHPWDQLPANDFVAECSYFDLTVTTTSISCPGTTLPSSGPNASQEFYVDDQHHSTPAIPPQFVSPPVCAYGAVVPTPTTKP